MAGNIFQQRITPVKPKVIDTQQIFVYVEEATYDKAGIASFTNEHFIVNNGKVELATLKLSSDPFNKPSLIQLDKNDFKLNNKITSINWPYAYKGNDNTNTNGWGLIKIGENSAGWLKYDANNLLTVDTDKVDTFVNGKIAPITVDVNNMKNSIDTAVALVDENNKLVTKLNSDFIKLDTKVSTYDDVIASKLNKNKNYAEGNIVVNTTIKNGDINGEILLESEYNALEGKFGKSRLVINENGVYIGHVDTDTSVTLEKIATEPYVQNELSKLTFIHILNTSSQLVIEATSDTVQTVATKYVQDNYGRDPQQWDGLVITMTDSSNDKILYTYTVTSQMWLNVGINNVDLTDYVSKDGIIDININYGDESVLYDTTDGITVTSHGQIKYKDNTVHQITTEYNLPIIAGENVILDADSTNKKVVISAQGGFKTFNGTNIELYNKIASGEFKAGDFVWLENVTKDSSLSAIGADKLVDGRVLAEIIGGPQDYNKSELAGNTIFERYYTMIIHNATLLNTAVIGLSNTNYFNVKYTENTSTYKVYFAARANISATSKVSMACYWFVSSRAVFDTKAPKSVYLTAISSVTKDSTRPITSGAVYTALENKQDKLTDTQLAAVNSGITSIDKTQIATNKTDIATLQTGKQDKLTAGENITIENNVISAKGGDLSNYYTKSEIDAMLPFSEDISGGNS